MICAYSSLDGICNYSTDIDIQNILYVITHFILYILYVAIYNQTKLIDIGSWMLPILYLVSSLIAFSGACF